ncbi:MAG: hypothetical protein WDO19_24735 [Bacteroidota bacterium]
MPRIQNNKYLIIITTVASLGGLLFGFDIAVISGVLPFVQKQFSFSAAQQGWFCIICINWLYRWCRFFR